MALKNFKTTDEIKVYNTVIEQVVGQEKALNIIKKAAKQKRNVLLIGEPGTGKSMLGMAVADLLDVENLVDILAYPNPSEDNKPLIRVTKAGHGNKLRESSTLVGGMGNLQTIFFIILLILSFILPWYALNHYSETLGSTVAGAIMFFTFSLGTLFLLFFFLIYMNFNKRISIKNNNNPKVIVDNMDVKKTPFIDATGAHSGALFGDVLHDPLQSFSPLASSFFSNEDDLNFVKLSDQVNELFDRHTGQVIKNNINEKNKCNHEAIFLDGKISILGESKDHFQPVSILSCNRYDYKGKMIKIKTLKKELIVTPEHKVAICIDGKTEYIEAKDVKVGNEVICSSEDIIIDEWDIINTYDDRQKKQCELYYEYLKIKKANSKWGYKRIAKAMNQNIGKTRWWHAGKHIPVPIITINWLKERKLLPLKMGDPNLPILSKILGATFGDGGIFENLNGIFLSSSELEAVKEFQLDIENVFNLEKNQNSRIIEGEEYGHSWCYQNTNRNILRLFLAIGAPRGKKTNIELKAPVWLNLNEKYEDEFYASLFGSELSTPTLHKNGNYLTSLEFAITGRNNIDRLKFFKQIENYLLKKQIICTSILTQKESIDTTKYRLCISKTLDNVLKFMIHTKLNYCEYKKNRLYKAIGEWVESKKSKYNELIQRYGAEHSMKLLNLTPNTLYLILNHFPSTEVEV